MGGVPALGEHTNMVLSELGFDENTVKQWRSDGVV
jgi:hypothetical protein